MRATCRSITDVNSSRTTAFSSERRSRASPALNCSPFERTEKGRSHDGTLPSPTAESADVTALKSPSGAIESTELFANWVIEQFCEF